MFASDSSSAFDAATAFATPTPSCASAAPPPQRRSHIVEADAGSRVRFEAFIAQRYAEVYGAQLYSFMPRLFGLFQGQEDLIAAFGLRGADAGALFLERYLDGPVEHLLTARFGRPVARREIAEVGNLAGASPGALRMLIPALTHRLREEGFSYIAFTGSARLCNGFARLGLSLSVAAAADVGRLPPEERRRWGTYYAHSPSVMLGDVAEGDRLLRAMAEQPGRLRARLDAVSRVGAP